ncbi:MAG: hypothetical protein LIP01_09325 [Tannerellaceae bacterium]|nr:hypothetical protein [Tannerellaceae bacterium]
MNLIKTLYYTLLCCLTIPVPAFSQNVVRQLTNADGLSNNSINCIFEDSRHILWVGTWDGLNAYNGRDFQVYRYNRNTPSSISNNVIRQIFEQSPGCLWIATDYGINRWDEDKQQFTNYFLGTEHRIPKEERSYLIGITQQKRVICYVKQQGFFILMMSYRALKLSRLTWMGKNSVTLYWMRTDISIFYMRMAAWNNI